MGTFPEVYRKLSAADRAAPAQEWDDMTAAEQAALASRLAVWCLDRLDRKPARYLGSPDPMWRAVGEAMQAELAARKARTGFRVVRTDAGPRP